MTGLARRFRRQLGAGLVATLCALVLVWSADAPRAQALDAQQVSQVIPAAAGSTGVVGVCLGSGVCEAAAVAAVVVGGAMVVGWGLKQLHVFGWGAGKEVEQPVATIPDVTSTYAGGCWSSYSQPLYNSPSVDERSTCSPLDGLYNSMRSDGMTWSSTPNGGGPMQVLISRGVDSDDGSGALEVQASWTTVPSTYMRTNMSVRLDCLYQPYSERASSWFWAADAYATGAASGSVSHSFPTCGSIAPAGSSTVRTGLTVLWAIPPCSGCVMGHYEFAPTPPSYDDQPAPSHRWRGTKFCRDVATGTLRVVSEVSQTFKEADSTLPDLPNPDCAGGEMPDGYEAHEGDANGDGGTKVLRWDPPASWADPGSVEYSDCLPGGSAAPCTVRVLKITPTGQKDCASGEVDCTDFDPTGAPTQQYKCQWGTHYVGLDQCVAVKTVLPVNPTTPTTVAGPTQIGPPADPEGPLPPPGDDHNGECFPNGWGLLNPIEWVLKPAKCALWWAFVPEHLGDRYADLKANAEGRVPFTWVGSITSGAGALAGQFSGAGCTPMVWNLPAVGPTTVLPCDVPFASIPRLLEKLAIWLAVAGLFWRLAPWNKGRETGGP